MISLGKVAAPKPLNLPSQKKENNGNDPTVNLISKSSGWGASGGGGDDAGGGGHGSKQHQHMERAIPAHAAPAWGGAGLPEERKKQVEIASAQEFPTLGSAPGGPAGGHPHHYDDSDPHRRPWDADERSYSGAPEDGPYRGGRGGHFHDRYHDRGGSYEHDRPQYERERPQYGGDRFNDRGGGGGRFDGPPGGGGGGGRFDGPPGGGGGRFDGPPGEPAGPGRA